MQQLERFLLLLSSDDIIQSRDVLALVSVDVMKREVFVF